MKFFSRRIKIWRHLSISSSEFLESLSPYESARVTSAGSVGASAWLTSFGRGNQTISSEQFRIALLWRLGLPQPILKGVHRCCKPGHPPVDPEGVHFVNRNCGSANSARHTAMNESSSGEWRTVRHDAIARVIRDCVHEAGFRTKWQPGNLPNLPNRFGDIEVYDFPHPGRSTILDNTCVCPYKGDRTLSQPPDGAPILAARVAESKKEETYSQMHRDQKSFIPLAYDVFGGAAPKAEDFLKQMLSGPFTQGEIRPLISCASINMFTKLHYILNWERAAPWPPQLGRAGSRGLADACWADSYTVWSPAQPATPQLHSSSSTPCLHTLAWEGGRKKPGLPSQCSTGLHNPAEAIAVARRGSMQC